MTEITKSELEPYLGQTFQIRFGEQCRDAELIEVSVIRSETPKDGRQEPFSVLFRTAEKEAYNQGIYPVTHEALGEHAIFLVPIGPDDTGMRYEAVFS